MASAETLLGGQPNHQQPTQDSTSQPTWHVDVDVDARTSTSAQPPAGVAAASVDVRAPPPAQTCRWTEVATAFAMATAVALCALLGTLFGDSSDSGLAGAAVALIVGAVCGGVIGLCYRWHDRSSPV